MAASAAVRPARDEDCEGLVALIGGCFAEYPGCVLDVDGEIPELRAIASHVAARDGRFWVAELAGAVVGSVGCLPAGDGDLELIKLYVAAPARRQGLGRRLVGLVEAEARARGAERIVLWSDTRFLDAHRLYHDLGYRRAPGTRALDDLSASIEARFEKRLGP